MSSSVAIQNTKIDLGSRAGLRIRKTSLKSAKDCSYESEAKLASRLKEEGEAISEREKERGKGKMISAAASNQTSEQFAKVGMSWEKEKENGNENENGGRARAGHLLLLISL